MNYGISLEAQEYKDLLHFTPELNIRKMLLCYFFCLANGRQLWEELLLRTVKKDLPHFSLFAMLEAPYLLRNSEVGLLVTFNL